MRTLVSRACGFTSFLTLLTAASSFVVRASPNVDDDRRDAAKSLARDIRQAHFRKLYVADFLDPSGVRNEQGCFFSSVFSTNLAKMEHDFVVVNRIEAEKQLAELHISAQDLRQPDVLAKAATALGADAVLVGSASVSPTEATLSLSLRDAASGREIHAVEYHERLEPSFEASFPATQSESGRLYYFPGLDGISQPKCIRCPDPVYTDEARRNRVQGTVVLSVTIDEKGMITSARVVKSPDEGLTKHSLNILKKWRMQPSHDIDGKAMPVRARIDIGFRMLN